MISFDSVQLNLLGKFREETLRSWKRYRREKRSFCVQASQNLLWAYKKESCFWINGWERLNRLRNFQSLTTPSTVFPFDFSRWPNNINIQILHPVLSRDLFYNSARENCNCVKIRPLNLFKKSTEKLQINHSLVHRFLKRREATLWSRTAKIR